MTNNYSIDNVKPTNYLVGNVIPNNYIQTIKPTNGLMDLATNQVYGRELLQGMPMGLLLALTYPTTGTSISPTP